jgi:hypothetical protein
LPTPVAVATSPGPGALDTLGMPDQAAFTQNLIFETVLYKGDTVFRPPDLEFRFIPVFNLTSVAADEAGVLKADTRADLTRTEGFVGIQGLFVDKHLRNVSERYDFDSLRIGIQPITADFRGFLFQDSPVGVRLFGNRNNNLWQYNLGWFRRLEKDTNSGLNDITETRFSDALRDDRSTPDPPLPRPEIGLRPPSADRGRNAGGGGGGFLSQRNGCPIPPFLGCSGRGPRPNPGLSHAKRTGRQMAYVSRCGAGIAGLHGNGRTWKTGKRLGKRGEWGWNGRVGMG